MLERFGELNDGSDSNNEEIVEDVDKVTRTEPHYIITRGGSGSVGSIEAVCQKGTKSGVGNVLGNLIHIVVK